MCNAFGVPAVLQLGESSKLLSRINYFSQVVDSFKVLSLKGRMGALYLALKRNARVGRVLKVSQLAIAVGLSWWTSIINLQKIDEVFI